MALPKKIGSAEEPFTGLADRLRDAKARCGLSLERVAKAGRIEAKTLESWYYDGVEPGALRLARVADGFNVSVDWLLGRTSDPLAHHSTGGSASLATPLRSLLLAGLRPAGHEEKMLDRHVPNGDDLLRLLVELLDDHVRASVRAERTIVAKRMQEAVADPSSDLWQKLGNVAVSDISLRLAGFEALAARAREYIEAVPGDGESKSATTQTYPIVRDLAALAAARGPEQ